jgi:hypothetical protein
VGGDDELRASADEIVKPRQERHLSQRRERRLRLVEQIESAAAKAMLDKGEKRLSMRLLMECACDVTPNTGPEVMSVRWLVE